MTRRSLPAKERLRLFQFHSGTCHICGGRINPALEAWDVEHVLALALGGDDSDANRQPAHVKCHRTKTDADLGHIAKAKRREARYLGARPRKPPSKFKRRVDGTVVLRNQ